LRRGGIVTLRNDVTFKRAATAISTMRPLATRDGCRLVSGSRGKRGLAKRSQ